MLVLGQDILVLRILELFSNQPEGPEHMGKANA